MKHECKKAWKKIKAKIDGKWYKVWAIRGCEGCKDLETCDKMEAIANRAGQLAVGLTNKIISKNNKGQANIFGIVALVYLVLMLIVLITIF